MNTSERERIARIICNVWGYNWDGDPEDEQTPPDNDYVGDDRPSKKLFLQAADAILKEKS